MPSKRDVLAQLSRDELLAVVDRFGLSPPDRRAKAGLVETVAASKKATLTEVLPKPSRVRLKELCRAVGVDDSGREKPVLVERISGVRVKADTGGSSRAKRAGRVVGKRGE
jgi:hypothetical protein